MDDKILTLNEVRDRLRIGKWQLRRLINEDPGFKTIKLGHRRVMREKALEDYLRQHEGKS